MTICFEHKIVIILLPTGLNKCLDAEKNHLTEYCKFGNIHEGFIFTNFRICEVS